MPVRIVLADDHAVLRDGLRRLLESAGYEIAGEAGHGRETVRLVSELKPDLAVVDISMPGLNGLDVTRAIVRESPGTLVIVLTMHADKAYVSEALQAGAKAYVLKTQASGDLVHAIEEVLGGRLYLSPDVSSAVVEALVTGTSVSADPLTPREREVLQLIAEGHSTKEVASVLGVSVKTAETHRTRLMSKLGIHHTAGLVRYALRRGLITT